MSEESDQHHSDSTRPDEVPTSNEESLRRKRKRAQLEKKTSSNRSAAKRSKIWNGQANAAQTLDMTSTNGHSSPFWRQVYSLYLPLAPISQLHPLAGICAEHLSPLILTYFPPFKGVVLSYSNAQLSKHPDMEEEEKEEEEEEEEGLSNRTVLAKSIDEYAASYVWVRAEFLLFRPWKGCRLEGWINLQNDSHVGLVCWNLFNASIERRRLPPNWKWIGRRTQTHYKKKLKQAEDLDTPVSPPSGEETIVYGNEDDTGYFQDEDGHRIEGSLKFQVKDVDFFPSTDREKGLISIEGTCLTEDEERKLLEQEQLAFMSRKRAAR